ncbi:DUF4396 domain-containing protein [Cetobacterium somerae]|uniref:DUF4396 domain-containing protein n=1 Tax=Cetobacterium sp. NK01 TaxID=2993530 RepID=UPI0021170FB0|nr:DUF4396 domain-containing protein [Cetobacterium sp. NK01]MCQ8213115.1 DUF4396 domain-containing protein [Cetobacterium sp. NK01]
MFNIISKFFIVIGILSALSITIDILKNPQKEMPIMNIVWPINGLWAGVFGVWAYFTIGKHRKMDMSNMDMKDMNMSDMDMEDMNMDNMKMNSDNKYSSFWQGVVADTLHCGAGCSLADLIGPWIFIVFPFTLFNNYTFGEWTLDYFLALLTGVTFQYAAISPMMNEKGPKIWLRALKIDFLSLTSWQIGMYGWMALVIFVWFGRLSPLTPEFWFMMQIAMCCGFITAYPVNWWLVKAGIKMGM